MVAEVVQLHDGAASLRDICAHLRSLADQIEAGEQGEVDAVFLIIPVQNDWPRVFAWGDVANVNDPVVQLELAKMWLLQNLVAR